MTVSLLLLLQSTIVKRRPNENRPQLRLRLLCGPTYRSVGIIRAQLLQIGTTLLDSRSQKFQASMNERIDIGHELGRKPRFGISDSA